MKVLYGNSDLGGVKAGFILTQMVTVAQHGEEFAARMIVHDEKELSVRLEGVL